MRCRHDHYPLIVRAMLDNQGRRVRIIEPRVVRQVLTPDTAHVLTQMRPTIHPIVEPAAAPRNAPPSARLNPRLPSARTKTPTGSASTINAVAWTSGPASRPQRLLLRVGR